ILLNIREVFHLSSVIRRQNTVIFIADSRQGTLLGDIHCPPFQIVPAMPLPSQLPPAFVHNFHDKPLSTRWIAVSLQSTCCAKSFKVCNGITIPAKLC